MTQPLPWYLRPVGWIVPVGAFLLNLAFIAIAAFAGVLSLFTQAVPCPGDYSKTCTPASVHQGYAFASTALHAALYLRIAALAFAAGWILAWLVRRTFKTTERSTLNGVFVGGIIFALFADAPLAIREQHDVLAGAVHAGNKTLSESLADATLVTTTSVTPPPTTWLRSYLNNKFDERPIVSRGITPLGRCIPIPGDELALAFLASGALTRSPMGTCHLAPWASPYIQPLPSTGAGGFARLVLDVRRVVDVVASPAVRTANALSPASFTLTYSYRIDLNPLGTALVRAGYHGPGAIGYNAHPEWTTGGEIALDPASLTATSTREGQIRITPSTANIRPLRAAVSWTPDPHATPTTEVVFGGF